MFKALRTYFPKHAHIPTSLEPIILFEALHLVDQKTRSKLLQATDVDQIHAILDDPSCQWQWRAPCLKHPDNHNGCMIPHSCDIESHRQPVEGLKFHHRIC